MKQLTFCFLACLLFSCNNSDSNREAAEVDSTTVADTSYKMFERPDTAYEVVHPGFYIWDVNVDKKTLKKNPELANKSINADSVINGLNMQYDGILLEKLNFHGDTINLRIQDSDYLTNQIGSSGAAQYIAQAVINLTSVPGIRYVHIDFKMGSHAAPDTWSRKDFPGYIIIQ